MSESDILRHLDAVIAEQGVEAEPELLSPEERDFSDMLEKRIHLFRRSEVGKYLQEKHGQAFDYTWQELELLVNRIQRLRPDMLDVGGSAVLGMFSNDTHVPSMLDVTRFDTLGYQLSRLTWVLKKDDAWLRPAPFVNVAHAEQMVAALDDGTTIEDVQNGLLPVEKWRELYEKTNLLPVHPETADHIELQYELLCGLLEAYKVVMLDIEEAVKSLMTNKNPNAN